MAARRRADTADMMGEVEIWTDGSSSGTVLGPGGYAAILRFGEHERVIVGGDSETTNNRMELLAAITALEALRHRHRVVVHIDSAYVCDCFTLGWWRRWRLNGWLNSENKPVANRDLWERLIDQHLIHDIRWSRVPGHHQDYPLNARCDQLAVEQKRVFQRHPAA
jgi:ribonuclease HI